MEKKICPSCGERKDFEGEICFVCSHPRKGIEKEQSSLFNRVKTREVFSNTGNIDENIYLDV